MHICIKKFYEVPNQCISCSEDLQAGFYLYDVFCIITYVMHLVCFNEFLFVHQVLLLN
uniref:Uncharacterized protein n=1 Tax=Arundo donax TaxID=35708 RepID=A0A0A9HQS9_ARUDO